MRSERVSAFIKSMRPDIELEIFELSDPVGISGSNTELEACVLTREVEKGGKMVNEAREKNGLQPVDLVFVDMILADE